MLEVIYRYLLPIAQAASTGGQNPIDLKDLNPLGSTTFLELLDKILSGAVKIAIPITTLMVIYGAFKILTAGANPNNLKEGKQIILWAIVGFMIVLVAGGITSIVTDFLSGGASCSPDPNSPNYQANCQGPVSP